MLLPAGPPVDAPSPTRIPRRCLARSRPLFDAQDQVKAERGLHDLTELSGLQLEGCVRERRRDVGALDGSDAPLAGRRARLVAVLGHDVGEGRPFLELTERLFGAQ